MPRCPPPRREHITEAVRNYREFQALEPRFAEKYLRELLIQLELATEQLRIENERARAEKDERRALMEHQMRLEQAVQVLAERQQVAAIRQSWVALIAGSAVMSLGVAASGVLTATGSDPTALALGTVMPGGFTALWGLRTRPPVK